MPSLSMTLYEKLRHLVKGNYMVGLGRRQRNILHIPDSRPTAKQLLSLLNATESTAVGLDDSMGGRTFMMR